MHRYYFHLGKKAHSRSLPPARCLWTRAPPPSSVARPWGEEEGRSAAPPPCSTGVERGGPSPTQGSTHSREGRSMRWRASPGRTRGGTSARRSQTKVRGGYYGQKCCLAGLRTICNHFQILHVFPIILRRILHCLPSPAGELPPFRVLRLRLRRQRGEGTRDGAHLRGGGGAKAKGHLVQGRGGEFTMWRLELFLVLLLLTRPCTFSVRRFSAEVTEIMQKKLQFSTKKYNIWFNS